MKIDIQESIKVSAIDDMVLAVQLLHDESITQNKTIDRVSLLSNGHGYVLWSNKSDDSPMESAKFDLWIDKLEFSETETYNSIDEAMHFFKTYCQA